MIGAHAVTGHNVVEHEVSPGTAISRRIKHVGVSNPTDEKPACGACVIQDWIDHDFVGRRFGRPERDRPRLRNRTTTRPIETTSNLRGRELLNWPFKEKRRHPLERGKTAIRVHPNDHRVSSQHPAQGHQVRNSQRVGRSFGGFTHPTQSAKHRTA